MHAKNVLKLDKPHVMGTCILMFESINKDNPLTTNLTIARANFTLNDPYHKFIQNPKSIQNRVSKMFQTIVQFYAPYIHVSKMFQAIAQFYALYIQICRIHDVNVFASIDFYGNCIETDDSFKGDKEPTKPRALFQNWRQDLFQYLFQDNMQSTDYSRASEVPSRRQKEDTNQISRPIQGPSDPHNSVKPHSKIDIEIIFGYENVYMKQHLRSQDVSQKYRQSTANAKIHIPAGHGKISVLLPDFYLISNLSMSLDSKFWNIQISGSGNIFCKVDF